MSHLSAKTSRKALYCKSSIFVSQAIAKVLLLKKYVFFVDSIDLIIFRVWFQVKKKSEKAIVPQNVPVPIIDVVL